MVPKKGGWGHESSRVERVGYHDNHERQQPTRHHHTDKSVETQLLTTYLPWQEGGVGWE